MGHVEMHMGYLKAHPGHQEAHLCHLDPRLDHNNVYLVCLDYGGQFEAHLRPI